MKTFCVNFYHWLWGDNNLRHDAPNYLINLEYGVSIKFQYDAEFEDYEEFYGSVADVQFLTGERPDQDRVQKLMLDAWNYLCLEERLLDEPEEEETEE